MAREISERGRRRSREKDNQGVRDIRFINILQLFLQFFSITLLYHFFHTFFPTTSTHDPRRLATLGIPAKLNSGQLCAGMPAVKTGMTNVAGLFCSHIGTVSQTVPAAMSQVQRRHKRTRLKTRYHK